MFAMFIIALFFVIQISCIMAYQRLYINPSKYSIRMISQQGGLSNGLYKRRSSITMSTVSDISKQIKGLNNQLKMDERTSLMIDALRGKNMNQDDKQLMGIDMKVVEFSADDSVSSDAEDVIPTFYDPARLDAYFKKRPRAVFTRIWQVVSTSAGYLFGLLTDVVTGNTKDMDVRRAKELRNTIVSLGPFFIKLGQALSIRPDILSPRAMVELQQLCDKVPSYNNDLAMKTIEDELGKPPSELFSEITKDPVAAASLGQVYKAKLKATGEQVAVKVQRPFVLETVSLDLYLVRRFGLFLRNFPDVSARIDLVSLLDEFAQNFYQELDYQNECRNGIKIAEDMKKLPMVVIPKNYPEYTARRVHTAEWVDGEKLSQSVESDVGALVNLGVITYLTQLLDTGFFHADPHPGNMLRTPDGKLVILDFGLMTKITDDQKYGMIEAIAHLIHRDYDEIGNDFVKLDFIPKGVDTRPIVPALARVFDAALSGGGAKSINFQELAADLAEITFKFPFRIPPYFALIIRAISVLEGIALVGNPEFAIVDEAYPYIARRLLTDEAPRLRAALKYMLYGKSTVLDTDRLIDLLQALEKFVAVKDFGDGKAFKVDGKRGNTYVGKGGDSLGTRKVDSSSITRVNGDSETYSTTISRENGEAGSSKIVREAFKFFFAKEGEIFRVFLLEEICDGVDALSRDAARELVFRLGIQNSFPAPIRPFLRALAPQLTADDRRVVDSIVRLVSFLVDGSIGAESDSNGASKGGRSWSATFIESASKPENRERLRELLPIIRQYAPDMRDYGLLVISRLAEKVTGRLLKATADAIFGDSSSSSSLLKEETRERSRPSLQSMPSPVSAMYVNRK